MKPNPNGLDEQMARARQLSQGGRHADAVAIYQQALASNPPRPDDWYDYAWLLKQIGQYDAALQAYARALSWQIARPEEVYLNCAVILTDHLGNHTAASEALHSAVRLNPNYDPAWLNLGNLHEEQGRRDDAMGCYQRILAKSPTGPHGRLWLEALARFVLLHKPDSADDPWLHRLEEWSASPSVTDPSARANLCFALGRVYEQSKRHDDAFAAFERANESVRRGGRAYDPKATERMFDSLIASAGQPSATNAQATSARLCPLFICGMFRSGSTLIEQVLNAHPLVAAGGELPFFPRLAAGPLAPYPAGLSVLDAATATRFADRYLEMVGRLIPPEKLDARYFSDKRPDNFLLLGLIKRVLPSARIIHTTRNPLDVGLSIYQQHLDQRVAPYSSDLRSIGHYYGQYERLMRHFEEIHAGDLLHFDYDDFVAAPEPALRRLLSFLQLPWHDDCLDFHRQTNIVKTASYWQVRRPLYRDASGRSRHYARQLEPLRIALEIAGVPLRQGEIESAVGSDEGAT
jgi:tetratricopeptide (TPR) repeat protein